VRFVVSVAFTPRRGVIHPSFPRRGRWERIAKRGEQAPCPSLASLLNSSRETHSCPPIAGLRQCQPPSEFPPSLSLTNTWLSFWISRTPQIRPAIPHWNSPKLIRECAPSFSRRFANPTWLQDPGNKIFRLPALSVFWCVDRKIPSWPSSAAISPFGGL
jgi:hypothetical protein